MVLTQNSTQVLLILCFVVPAIKASSVAVQAMPPNNKGHSVSVLEVPQPTFKELLEAKRYEEAILALDPTQINPRAFDMQVEKTGNIPLIIAFAEKCSPICRHTWSGLFHFGGLDGSVPICEALWGRRHLASYKDQPIKLMLEMMIHATTQGNISFIKWALDALKEADLLHELNRARISYRYERPIDKNKSKKEEIHYASALIAAADNNKRKIVSILLLHGASMKVKGYGDASWPLACAGNRGYHDLSNFLELYYRLQSIILSCIRNGVNLQVANSYLKAAEPYKALIQCRELASEYLIDEGGNNALHNAILAQDRKAIILCLRLNRNLIQGKNREGLTPLQLAVGKLGALAAILDFCYAKKRAVEK